MYDVSGGGVRLRLGYPIGRGKRIDMLMYFPDDPKPVGITARSVWCKEEKMGFNIGLQYIEFKDKEKFIMLFCGMMVDYFVLSDREKYGSSMAKRRREYAGAQK